MASSETKDMGDIISDGIYRIPNYQRGFAWTGDEVDAFLDDIWYVTEKSDESEHYLGSIIVTEQKGSIQKFEVIDGQQRLITTLLIAHELLRKARIESQKVDDDHVEHLKNEIERKIFSKLYEHTAPEERKRRILPAEEHRETFKNLYLENPSESRNLSSILSDADSPSAEKLVEAVETIESRLEEWMEEQDEGESRSEKISNRLVLLDRLARALITQLKATKHPVNDRKEAGRMFEAVNDRGRELNRADKIKSFLVYRVSTSDIDIDVRDIHEAFAEVYSNLNDYTTNPAKVDSLVDRLIGQHWRMFANEDSIGKSESLVGRFEEVSSDLEQIKHAKYHAPKQRSDLETKKWIEAYLDSLTNSSEAYVAIRGISQEEIFKSLKEDLGDDNNPTKVRHSFYVSENFGPSTYDSLLMAFYLRFRKEPEFQELLKEFETLVMRIFQVGGARRDTKRTKFESLSRALFWDNREDLHEVFPKDSPIVSDIEEDIEDYELRGGSKDIENISNRVSMWAYDYSHEVQNGSEVDDFKRRLREDNLKGLNVPNWSGIGDSEAINYMLYRYEEEIRKGGLPVKSYIEANVFKRTVEHVWPSKRPSKEEIAPSLKDEKYAQAVDRLGNLALLSISENASAGNSPYEKKWNSTYRTLTEGTEMFSQEFPDPEGTKTNEASDRGHQTWSKEVIDWRSKKMAEKLANYWSATK